MFTPFCYQHIIVDSGKVDVSLVAKGLNNQNVFILSNTISYLFLIHLSGTRELNMITLMLFGVLVINRIQIVYFCSKIIHKLKYHLKKICQLLVFTLFYTQRFQCQRLMLAEFSGSQLEFFSVTSIELKFTRNIFKMN